MVAIEVKFYFILAFTLLHETATVADKMPFKSMSGSTQKARVYFTNLGS